MSRVRVLSYNVRYDNRHDVHDAWHERREGVTDVVRFHRPDVVAFQEVLPNQRRDLRERLSAYTLVGRGREPGDEGESCPIGVRADRWAVADHGTFWLSPTPDEPSAGWDAAHPRIATWARVRPAAGDAADDGASFLVANTHFDHVSARARVESARLLDSRVPSLAADDGADVADTEETPPVVLVGDLNCTPGSEPHAVLTDGGLRDAAAAATVRHGPRTSLTDYAGLIENRRIDHALVSPAVDVEAFGTLADRDDRGRYPSDHLPVLARLWLESIGD
ncbi:endonuclease/exonuclease/phosphatase family protein [Halorubrum sp. SY-15]|jgi:endonuclease/exonuclease/phosphatase family metal-dependent hydrolase|uniref:endonuclease/exonuclease/phosphatase family protein n=1 Tax=Halorubrum sp. SY-15 TaxID=3402277 RepID=UPI003EC090A2